MACELRTDASYDGGNLSAVGELVYAGQLLKRKEDKKKPDSRWCEIRTQAGGGNPRLTWRKTEDETQVKGVMGLHGARVTVASDTGFHIMPSDQINQAKRSQGFHFEASDQGVRDGWLEVLAGTPQVNMPTGPLCTLDYAPTGKSSEELVADMLAIGDELGVPTLLGMQGKSRPIENYLTACLAGMNDKPFHSKHHAADVLQMLFYMVRASGLKALLSPLQIVSLFIAAPAHDLDHRGTTIGFERAIKSDIGRRYPDSPLEAHHATLAMALIDKTGLLAELSSASAELLKESVRQCILCTDMSRHSDTLEEFRNAEEELMSSHTAFDFFTHGPKGSVLCNMLLKAADISNPTRPPATARDWNLRCYEEFHAEGAANRKAGREVAAIYDPVNSGDEVAIAKLSMGFIDYAVIDNVSELLKFSSAAASGKDAPGLDASVFQEILDSVTANRAAYAAVAAGDGNPMFQPEPEGLQEPPPIRR